MGSDERWLLDLKGKCDSGDRHAKAQLLEALAGMLRKGTTPPRWLAEIGAGALLDLASIYKIRGKAGRPKGAISKQDTVGRKRARRFFDLTDEGMKSTLAAKKVAAEFGVPKDEISRIYHDAKRHERALTEETISEANQLAAEVEEMQRISDMGPHQPQGLEYVLQVITTALKGQFSSH